MFNVCPGCGIYSDEKLIDLEGLFAICSHCGYRHRFVQLPLFILTGASGSGKSRVCLELVARMSECVFLENDLFWRTEFASPEDNYYNFRNLCLRVAKNISQAGRPVVLCGSAIPEQYEACTERRFFPRHTTWLWFVGSRNWSGDYETAPVGANRLRPR